MLLQGYRSTFKEFANYPTARAPNGDIDPNQSFFSLENEDGIRNGFPHLLGLPFTPHHLTILDQEWCRNTLWSKLASVLRCKLHEEDGKWHCVVCGMSFESSEMALQHDMEICTP
jgi:hypothetical protein